MKPAVARNPILTGYESLHLLYEGKRTLVYQAVRTVDQRPVVIKTSPQHLPLSFSDHLAFRNQFTIGQHLDHPGIVPMLSLESVDNTYALVMEDVQETSLEDLKLPLSLAEGLQIAVQLADILHYLSQERVIHKDIKPANILIDPDHRQIYLIDFSLSSLLPKETQEIKNPDVLEGTLAYMAPEQTGRMNRGIDFRTDFYGLGVTLFEFFSGQLPFQADEPIDWLHCHIAKQPPSLTEFGLPASVASIVTKLLAKNAEDRYQSALGLKHDLEQCFTQLTEQGEIEIFELGVRDVSDRFLIPEKLYGREVEVQALLDAFDRVVQGSSELMLVAGSSGIGKTAVVNEVHKPITQKKGYFIKGKFDQFNRNIPFSAFVQAFRSLIGQLLGESDAQLSSWQAKILEAVGESGQVLIEVIPELERIIGDQPAVPELSGAAAQNRFNLLFCKFIQVFTIPEHPLVIFLDDLQWADLASLNLLKLLMAESEAGYLLILGAYRDNEVFPTHPLMMTLDEMEEQLTAPQTLTLQPLSQGNINVLVADTLKCELEVAAPLTDVMYTKTQGNPFFTNQFFLSLYEDGYITYGLDSGYWQCDLTQVRQLAFTDDVVAFMVGQLQKLPDQTLEILTLAACIGNRFQLNTLSVVCEQPQDSIAIEIWPSLQAGLVVPESETYKFFQKNSRTEELEPPIALTYRFLHDRVQQAAYSLIPEIEKESTHYQIGKLLSHNISPEEIAANIFAIVGQLNRGQTLLTNQSERDNLAQLNLTVGLRSKNATAYKAGFEYANIGLSLLGENLWQRQYELALNLKNLAAELAFLIGDFSAMNSLIVNIQENVREPIDKSSSVQTQIQFYISQQNFKSAIFTASIFLQEIDFCLPNNLSFEEVQQEYRVFQPYIKPLSLQQIVALPLLTDQKQLAVANILMSISVPAIVSDTNLFWFIILKLVELSLKNGNSHFSAYAYASYGILINLIEQDIEKYYQFGQLSLEVVDLFEQNITRCRAFEVVGSYTIYLKSHLRTAIPLLEKAYKSGLESGDFEFASYSIYTRCQTLFFSGELLPNLETELFQGVEALNRLNNQFSLDLQQLIDQAVLKLTGQLDKPHSLDGSHFDLDNIFESLKISNDKFSLQHFCLYEILLKYLFSDRSQVLPLVEKAEECLDSVTGWLTDYIFCFYESLVYLDHIDCTEGLEEEHITQYLQKVKKNQHRFANLAASAPMNFQHKYDLVEAERNRILDHKFEALERYDAAIAGAKEHHFIQEEALANELASKFYLAWGKEKIASIYMQEAYHCYARWGAKAKTDDLEQRYPDLLQPILQQTSQVLNPLDTLASLAAPSLSIHSSASIHSHHASINTAFDFAAILQGAQTLAESLNLDELLERLAPMMLQNSGADRLVLLLPEMDETWHVRVTATSEKTQLSSVPFTDTLDLPVQLIQYVKNTQEVLVVDDLDTDLPVLDGYLQQHQPRSILCMPICYQGNLSGLLYLQNQSAAGVFTCDRITVLNFLCSQAAIALENAQLYRTLEQRVDARTQALQKNQNTLQKLLVGTGSVTGEEVFPTLAVQIANALQCSHVLISQICGETLATLAWYTNNQLQAKLIYPRANTPCETSIQQGSHYCSSGVQEAYPLDPDLVEMGVDSYLGVALQDHAGQVIGVLCILDYESIENMEFARMVLRVFGERAAAELERQQAEQALEQLNYDLEARVRDRTIQLADSEQRLQTLFDQAADAVLLLGEDGFIDCNQATLDLFRYTHKSEIIALLPHQVSPEQQPDGQRSVDKAKTLLQETRQRGSYQFEWVHQRANGENFWAEVTLTPIKYQEETIFHSLVQDINDRKAAEDSLRESEAKFRNLISNLDGVVYRSKFDADWTLEFVSDAIADLSGYPAADFIHNRHRSFASIIHPDDVEMVNQGASQGIAARQPFELEYRILHREGSVRWVTEKGKGIVDEADQLQYLEGVIFDISDRKAADFALQDSQAQFRRMTENVPGMIYRWILHRDGSQEFTYISAKVRELFELEPEAVLQNERLIWDRIHPDDRPRLQDQLISNSEIVQPFKTEFRLIFPQKGIRWVQINSQPERMDNGDVIWDGVLVDISDHKQREQEQQRLVAILESTTDYIGRASSEGYILWHNQAFRQFRPDLGNPEEQIHLSVANPEWAYEMFCHEAIPTALQQGTWSGESAILDQEGNEIPVSQVLIAHKSEEGDLEYFSTIIRDIRDLKQTTAALSLSEARLDAAFEQAAMGLAETDIKTGRFIRVNTLLCELTGYTKAEFAEKRMSELTHPEDISASLQAMGKLSLGEIDSFTLEKRYVCKDGTYFWAETTVCLVKLQGEEAVYSLGMVRDISDRKATEKALSLTQFALQNAATSLFWINEAGRFLEVNEAACQTLGYFPEELMEKYIWDIDPDFSSEVWPEHWQTLKQSTYQQFESHHQTKDHRLFPVEITSNYLDYDGQGFIFAQVQDISIRKQAETALQFTQYSVDNAADCTFWIKPNGGFAYANQAASTMHGYAIDELMLMSVFEINPHMTVEGWERHWQDVKQRGSFSLEGDHQTREGRVFPVEVVVNYLEFDGDEFNFVRVRDISDRKAAEAERDQLNTELEQRVQERTQELSKTLTTLKSAQVSLVESEKMAALGTLVAGVAHEINTPIGTSITVASTLADETEIFLQAMEAGQLKRSVLNRYLDVARRCSMLLHSNLERAGDLIQSFKQVAVDQSYSERRTFNLKAYLQEVVTSLQPQAKRSGHQLHLTGEDTIMLTNDPGVFAQVVTNLVTNSIKHAYPNGDSGHLQIQIDRQDDQVVLTYRDDGCGIPSEYLSKVYEPFFTTARRQGGTGLGLNIVYNIVCQSLKGTIEIESQEGQGTTFVISLPSS